MLGSRKIKKVIVTQREQQKGSDSKNGHDLPLLKCLLVKACFRINLNFSFLKTDNFFHLLNNLFSFEN